jgi:hypothetical protein
MVRANIPMTQESSRVEITNEDSSHCFLLYQGFVHFEFIPQGQEDNQAYYVEILKQICEAEHRRPEHRPDRILNQHNAPPHKVLSGPKIDY